MVRHSGVFCCPQFTEACRDFVLCLCRFTTVRPGTKSDCLEHTIVRPGTESDCRRSTKGCPVFGLSFCGFTTVRLGIGSDCPARTKVRPGTRADYCRNRAPFRPSMAPKQGKNGELSTLYWLKKSIVFWQFEHTIAHLGK